MTSAMGSAVRFSATRRALPGLVPSFSPKLRPASEVVQTRRRSDTQGVDRGVDAQITADGVSAEPRSL